MKVLEELVKEYILPLQARFIIERSRSTDAEPISVKELVAQLIEEDEPRQVIKALTEELVKHLPDDMIVAEVKRRSIVFEPNDISNDAFKDELATRITDEKITIREVLAVLDTFVFNDDTIEAIEQLCDKNDLRPELGDEINASHPLMVAAAELAFANAFQVMPALQRLREIFAEYNINSMATFNSTDVL